MDTIYAPATARGRAGVAVVRLSGPEAWSAVSSLTKSLPAPRVASLRKLRNGAGELLDEALVVLFEAGRSFTGERVAELHLHGSHAVVSAVLDCLAQFPGVRLAAPGEFTRRALENDRLDLTQVEALADLINAETEAQRKQAVRVLSGEIGRRAQRWRSQLLRVSARVEAIIDFADEDLPGDLMDEVQREISCLLNDLDLEIAGCLGAERIRDGFEVAIIGRPNVGKSTLLNAIAGREAAITSAHAGTTRDVLEVRIDLKGYAVTLLDTAGMRESKDEIERIGVARAKDRAEAADLRIFLVERVAEELEVAAQPGDIVVRAKGDLAEVEGPKVSGRTGEGLDALLGSVAETLASKVSGVATITHARHAEGLARARDGLRRAVVEIDSGSRDAEVIAEELRLARHAIDSLVGHVDVEEMLGEIFSSFCIGK